MLEYARLVSARLREPDVRLGLVANERNVLELSFLLSNGNFTMSMQWKPSYVSPEYQLTIFIIGLIV